MSSTELRKNGCDIKRMTDKMAKFCLAYLVHGSGAQAVRDAGYKASQPGTYATRLMKDPRVKAMIGKARREDQEKFELERHEILWNLWACASRNGKQFVDDDGRLHENLNELPDEVTAAIDSIKQKVRTFTNNNGEEMVEVETEVKLVSKAAALDMAMKHKGLFAAEKVEVRQALDIDALFRDTGVIDVDPIQQRLDQERNE